VPHLPDVKEEVYDAQTELLKVAKKSLRRVDPEDLERFLEVSDNEDAKAAATTLLERLSSSSSSR